MILKNCTYKKMSVIANENTAFQNDKHMKIYLKCTKRYLLDNYNNGKNPTFHWIVGFLLYSMILK